jgi:hypothetical protein
MLVLYAKGVEVRGKNIGHADEVVSMVGYAKADQNGQGSVVNVFEAADEDLCVVKLLKRMNKLKPGCFEQADSFVFKTKARRVVSRDRISDILRKVAAELGILRKGLFR